MSQAVGVALAAAGRSLTCALLLLLVLFGLDLEPTVEGGLVGEASLALLLLYASLLLRSSPIETRNK